MPTLLTTFTVTTTLSLIIMKLMEQLTGRISLIGTFMGLQVTKNSGIALGFHLPAPWQNRFILIALMCVAVAGYFYQDSKTKAFSFGLILGGATANIIDRFLDGAVTDYVQVGFFPWFNLPDTAICLGVGLIVIESIFDR